MKLTLFGGGGAAGLFGDAKLFVTFKPSVAIKAFSLVAPESFHIQEDGRVTYEQGLQGALPSAGNIVDRVEVQSTTLTVILLAIVGLVVFAVVTLFRK